VQVQGTVPVPEADHGHGPQAKGVRGAHQCPAGAGDRMDRRLDRMEVVLAAAPVVVPGVATGRAAGDRGAGRAGARLVVEPEQPVADQPDVQRAGDVPGVPGAVVCPVRFG